MDFIHFTCCGKSLLIRTDQIAAIAPYGTDKTRIWLCGNDDEFMIERGIADVLEILRQRGATI